MDAELSLLEKAMRVDAVGVIMEHRLAGSFERWGRAAEAILAHHVNFSSAVIPLPELLRLIPDWPDAELEQTELEQPMDYYVQAFKTQALFGGVNKLMAGAARHQKLQDPQEAMAEIRRNMTALDDLTRSSKEVDLVRAGDVRWEEYKRRKAMDGIIGVPFPWKTLTDQTGGMQKGTVTAIVGRTGIGKSMTLMLAAETARAAGFRPLLFPLEMTDIQWGIRWDAYRLKLPFEDIRLGRLDSVREKIYQEALLRETPENEPGYIVITDDEHSSVSGITAKVEEYRPDLVIIDGIYLLDDDQNKEGWEGLKNISNALKKLAKRADIPILVTTQFTAEVGMNKMDCDVDKDIAYGKALRQDCDNIIGIFQDQDMLDQSQMLMRLKKFREGRPLELILNWNWAMGNFSEFGTAPEGAKVVDSPKSAAIPQPPAPTKTPEGEKRVEF